MVPNAEERGGWFVILCRYYRDGELRIAELGRLSLSWIADAKRRRQSEQLQAQRRDVNRSHVPREIDSRRACHYERT